MLISILQMRKWKSDRQWAPSSASPGSRSLESQAYCSNTEDPSFLITIRENSSAWYWQILVQWLPELGVCLNQIESLKNEMHSPEFFLFHGRICVSFFFFWVWRASKRRNENFIAFTGNSP
jgi:hypothetical protein